jgi:hypothetical protein
MKILLFLIFFVVATFAQNNTETNTIPLDPFMIVDNGMTLLTLLMVGHLYKNKVGIASSCEDSKNNRSMKFTMQSRAPLDSCALRLLRPSGPAPLGPCAPRAVRRSGVNPPPNRKCPMNRHPSL